MFEEMRRRKEERNPAEKESSERVSLKQLAAHLGLSPTTLSLVLNESPLAKTIPEVTRERIIAAAREFNYRPNYLARSLRAQRSFTLGVIVPEVSDGYSAMVLNGIEDHLLNEGYFYFVASHRHRADLIEKYPKMLMDRRVEGLIAVDTPCHHLRGIPAVAVSGHDEVEGITNIILDHDKAADLALRHLVELGHQQIAMLKGQDFSSDTEIRFKSIRKTAKQLGVQIKPRLIAELKGDSPSPELGYLATQQLLMSREPFTALFAFNDISAIGAIRAFREAGKRVPEDISVVGFDDIFSASFYYPSLTTVQQPLQEMGKLAARTVLERIARAPHSPYPKVLVVEPKLIIRQSTATAS